MPTISVIVPVYKVEKYIRKCVDSLLCQTYPDLEIILVDDGSPDRCPQICDEYATRDDRIHVIHQKNQGLSAARNTGISAAKGDFIGFVDSDDYIAPDMYAQLQSLLASANADLAICSFFYADEGETVLPDDSPLKDEILDTKQALQKIGEPKWWYYVMSWNKLYRKSLFSAIRYPQGKLYEDSYIIHELLFLCKKVVTTSAPLYFYVQRNDSIMHASCPVSRLDDVEGLYVRYLFYKQHHLKDLYPGLGVLIREKYIAIRSGLHASSPEESARIEEIDAMFREAYFSCIGQKKWLERIKFISPSTYFAFLPHKEKAIRRLKTVRALLQYTFQCRKKPICLVNTPVHGNLGDHAIVLAELQLLHNHKLSCTELTGRQISGHEKLYARVTPKGNTILIHGGGYLGNIWPEEEYLFRRLLRAFGRHKVIVFPQTVTFDLSTKEGLDFFEASKKIYDSHPDLTLFVREKASYAFMRTHMPKVRTLLVPDMVTILTPLCSFPQDRNRILLCMRKDREQKLSPTEYQYILDVLRQKYPFWEIVQTDTVAEQQILPQHREKAVYYKLLQFAQARLVVTDRLHGMIFSAITATPCIAFGNRNGKVQGVYQWLRDNPYLHYLKSPLKMGPLLEQLDTDSQQEYRLLDMQKKFSPLLSLLMGRGNLPGKNNCRRWADRSQYEQKHHND